MLDVDMGEEITHQVLVLSTESFDMDEDDEQTSLTSYLVDKQFRTRHATIPAI